MTRSKSSTPYSDGRKNMFSTIFYIVPFEINVLGSTLLKNCNPIMEEEDIMFLKKNLHRIYTFFIVSKIATIQVGFVLGNWIK